MINTIARRLAWTVVVAWFVVTATFAMVVAIPADPAKLLLGPHATPDAIERVRAHYCLDRGPLAEYGCYVASLARGDLGESYRSKRAVSAILADRAWPTVQLALATVALQFLVGVALGVVAAWRRGRWPDRTIYALAVIGLSAPPFVIGSVLLYVVAFRWGWLPLGGYGAGVLDRLRHLALPAMTLATAGVAIYARVARAEVGDALREDFVRTARAKGVPEASVVVRHALRASLGPLVTLIGIDLGVLLGGAVVVEDLFAWPGLGREVMQAIAAVDIPLILGVVLVAAIAIAIVNLLVDLAYVVLDPRLRT